MFVSKSTLRTPRKLLVPGFFPCFLLGTALLVPAAADAQVTVESALKFVPVQKDVDYYQPAGNELAKCTVKAEQMGGSPAWVVRGPAGQVLRSFVDTNKDNRVDEWCYFQNGVESYRDLDTNFNGKADQFRWLGLSGMKWGLDKNEDGTIDSWNQISAEEISGEIVAALGLGKEATKKIADRISTATRRFQAAVASQKSVAPNSEWIHFSASRPAAIPKGTNGATSDVFVYENVAAMLDKGQLPIGTLVQASGQWRAIDIPIGLMAEAERNEFGSFLLTPSLPNPVAAVAGGMDAATQELVKKMTKIDSAIREESDPKKRDLLYDEYVGVLRQLAGGKTDQQIWIKQLVETLGTAVQAKEYSRGRQELQKLQIELKSQAGGELLAAKAAYVLLNAEYTEKLHPKADFDKVQQWWIESLEGYISENRKGPDFTEALMQLAIAEEGLGDDNWKVAVKHYQKIVSEGEGEVEIAKAKGAVRRLTSVGKRISYRGTSMTDRSKTISTDDFKGKFVLLHFWATWDTNSLTKMKQISRLKGLYGDDLAVISVNVDTDQEALMAYAKANPLPKWSHVYEPGGLESKPATDLGIMNSLLIMLIDTKGELVDRDISLPEATQFIGDRLDG